MSAVIKVHGMRSKRAKESGRTLCTCYESAQVVAEVGYKADRTTQTTLLALCHECARSLAFQLNELTRP